MILLICGILKKMIQNRNRLRDLKIKLMAAKEEMWGER